VSASTYRGQDVVVTDLISLKPCCSSFKLLNSVKQSWEIITLDYMKQMADPSDKTYGIREVYRPEDGHAEIE
jgi:hypothetical protein